MSILENIPYTKEAEIVFKSYKLQGTLQETTFQGSSAFKDGSTTVTLTNTSCHILYSDGTESSYTE